MKPLTVKLSKPPQSSFKYKKIKLDALEFNWHCHAECELMFMSKSKGKRFIGDSISFYRPGDLFLIGPNLPHAWYSPAGIMSRRQTHEAILVQFAPTIAGLNVEDVPEFKSLRRLFVHARRGVQFFGRKRGIVARQMIEMESLEGLEKLMLLLRILDLLGQAEVSEYKLLSGLEFTNTLKPIQQGRVDRVCTYINKHYKRELRLGDGAEIANMSVTGFSRFFKKSTGKTFVEFVNELRVGHACKLLIETELTISEICYEVGFNNISNFNRRFCENQNMNPGKYRREFDTRY